MSLTDATIQVADAAGNIVNSQAQPAIIAGAGTAGTPDAKVLSVQGVSAGTPIPFTADPNRQVIFNNGGVSATGTQVLTGYYGASEISLYFNITGAAWTGGGTVTFKIEEVDPGDLTTVETNTSSSSSALAAPNKGRLTLLNTHSPVVKVTWTIAGTVTGMTGLYLTVVSKSGSAILPYTLTNQNVASLLGAIVNNLPPSAGMNIVINDPNGNGGLGAMLSLRGSPTGAVEISGEDGSGVLHNLFADTNRVLGVGGLTAEGGARVQNSLPVAGVNAGNITTMLMDASGRQIVVGSVASAGIVANNPVLIGVGDGTPGFVRVPKSDSSGYLIHKTIDGSGSLQVAGVIAALNSSRVEQRRVVLQAGVADGATLDATFWGSLNSGSATNTQGSGVLTMSTGVTLNSNAIVFSNKVSWYVPGTVMLFHAVLRVGDTGTALTTRRWGVGDIGGSGAFTNGFFFELAASTLNVVTRSNTSDTKVASGSWNGTAFSLDTNFHRWEILYYDNTVYFLIDGVVVHSITAVTTNVLTQAMNLGLHLDNRNDVLGGSVNVQLVIREISLSSYGAQESVPQWVNSPNTAGATIVAKRGAGRLKKVCINKAGTASQVQLFDNTAGSGTSLGIVGTTVIGTLHYDLIFNTGLTLVNTATTPADYTVVFE